MNFSQRYGPWALVTGAGRGLGAAYSEELTRRGVSVLALDVEPSPLSETVELLRSQGATVEPVVVDLAAQDMLSLVREQVADREVGLLINNAALSRVESFFDQDPQSLQRVQRVNCDAPLMLTREYGPPMRARGHGGIVLVSSLSMVCGAPLLAHYAATKAFDAVLAEGLYEELHGTGVDITTVLGPKMDTPGLRATKPHGPDAGAVPPRVVARATLDGLGRQGRVVVGRDGHVLTQGLLRLLPHERVRRLVANGVRKMYPGR